MSHGKIIKLINEEIKTEFHQNSKLYEHEQHLPFLLCHSF